RHLFKELSPKWVIEESDPDKNIPNFESIKHKVEVSQTKAKSRYEELKNVRDVDFKIGERVTIRRPYNVKGSKYFQETKVIQVSKHSVKVEGASGGVKEAVARLGQDVEMQGFQIWCKGSEDVTVGPRRENSMQDLVVFDGSSVNRGGASGVVNGAVDTRESNGERGMVDDINVIEQEEIQNCDQRESTRLGENQYAEQEQFPDKLQKKRVINKPKYLEDFFGG
ncbi:hypothetical protein NDU88_001991, partial [Pleurodeles waltl]